MTAPDDLLRRIETEPALADLLNWPGDFDVTRRDPVEELRLPTGMPLHPIAGCAAGGTYFLCGEPGTRRPVLYADSEGQASLIGEDLTEAITLIAAFPYWQDLGLGFPVEELEADMLDDQPDFDESRDRLLSALGLTPPPAADALARLRAAAERTAPDFVPASVEHGLPYGLLFSRD
ncbi:hypothetical protein [Actinomadura craniellae]|nr:hypothetical protein [Actinomadura craniellae]